MTTDRRLKISLALLLCVLGVPAVLAQDQMNQKERELDDYIKGYYTKREVMIPMRDGVKLFPCIYEPKGKDKKYPIMFDRTPYSVGPYGASAYKTSFGPDEWFAREGNTCVYKVVRGRCMSEAVSEDVRPYIP